ncbi:isocitrate/isopropylmalate dehydrogenase family protein [Methanosarcinales archaeon]|nr:MAG: isocitrate/isopropylmalate dehydrogenase family protein [Methanosarcinales archaeon]
MKKLAVIKGDGVGPELVEHALDVMEQTEPNVEIIVCDAGYEWWQRHGGKTLIPDETWDILKESDACFKGATTTPPDVDAPKSVAVSIRQSFNLYANVRPIRSFPNTKAPLGEVEFVCVREATEGLYFGEEFYVSDDVALAIRKVSRKACEKVSTYAFSLAKQRGWDTVVAIHKSNILKRTCGLFLETVKNVKEYFPEVDLWEYHVDNVAQQIIKNPQLFNQKVLLSTNLFMDIISEECSALVGSIGMVYSGNFGDSYAMFEAAHGSAPKYKGQDKVNPTATILAGAWALEYLGEQEASEAIFKAVERVIAEGKYTTYDLGGSAKTSEMVEAIKAKLKNQ